MSADDEQERKRVSLTSDEDLCALRVRACEEDRSVKASKQHPLTEHLNGLAEKLDDAARARCSAALDQSLPATEDPQSMRRVVLQTLLAETLAVASADEKEVFVAALLDEVFAREAEEQESALSGVSALVVPQGIEGAEVLRVFVQERDQSVVTLVLAEAQTPQAWGVILHDVAGHITDHAVESGLVPAERRRALLRTIAASFAAEHRRPTGASPSPYKPTMDS